LAVVGFYLFFGGVVAVGIGKGESAGYQARKKP